MGILKMKKPWYRPAMGGWIFLPVSWQGFAITFLTVILLFQTYARIDATTDSFFRLLTAFVPRLILFVIIYYVFAFLTSGKHEGHNR